MDREDVMFWKAILPGMAWLLAGVAAAWTLSGLPDSPLTAGLFSTLRWGPLLMAGWGLLQLAAGGYRVWQWHRGEGLLCECGGMLGSERDGRWGRYRKCMACGRNVNCRHYE